MSAGAHHLLQTTSHLDQKRIPDLVAMRVVDRLEVVEIEQTHGEQALVPLRVRQCLLDPVREQRAVRQMG